MIFCIFKHIKSNIILINMGKVRRCRQYNQPPIAIREGVMISSQNITDIPSPSGTGVASTSTYHNTHNEFSISLFSGQNIFLAPSGAQGVTMSVCLSVPVKSFLEHSVLDLSLLGRSQVSLVFL